MKLLIAIVQNQDSKKLSEQFVENGFRATKLSSTGGFLKSGNTTFLIGTNDSRVDEAKQLIHDTCSTRKQTMVNPPSYDFTMESELTYPIDVEVGGATVFVLPIDEFTQF